MIEIGKPNAFDALMIKRASYDYEREVRLVHWDTNNLHDPLSKFLWNNETMRFDDIVEDPHLLRAGIAVGCQVDVMIERVIVSPFAPQWYLPMIERLKNRLNYQFSVAASRLLTAPPIAP